MNFSERLCIRILCALLFLEALAGLIFSVAILGLIADDLEIKVGDLKIEHLLQQQALDGLVFMLLCFVGIPIFLVYITMKEKIYFRYAILVWSAISSLLMVGIPLLLNLPFLLILERRAQSSTLGAEKIAGDNR